MASDFIPISERAVDVRTDEVVRTMNGPVHVALGGKMNYGARTLALQKASHQIAVDDIALLKQVRRVRRDGFKIARVPRIGQLVQIEDGRRLLQDPLQDEIRADESRSARNQNQILHVVCIEEGGR